MSTHPSHPSVNLCHLFSTQTCKYYDIIACSFNIIIHSSTDGILYLFYTCIKKWQYIIATHLAQSAWVSWMKRRDGVQQSQSNKCCWGFKTCWIHQIPIVLLNQKLTIFSSITKLSISDEWRRRHERILLARKWENFHGY